MSSVMFEEEFKFLNNSRKYVRGEVTRSCNKVKNEIDGYSHQQALDGVKLLDDIHAKLDRANEHVARGAWKYFNEDRVQEELAKCTKYDTDIFECKCLLEAKSRGFVVNSTNNGSQPNSDSHRLPNRLKLPQLPLPSYSHADSEDLDTFFEQFENIVNKYNISDYERFIFLSEQLSGEPLALVKSLRGAEQSYDEAKNLLYKAFASPTRRKHEIIDRLVHLKLNKYGEIYSYISEYRLIVKTFGKLKVDTNDLIQYFLWNSMPKGLQTQFVHICNNNNPTLDEIDENLFEAADRFNSMKKSSTEDKIKTGKPDISNAYDAYGLAADVKISNPRAKFCSLCAHDGKVKDHATFKCPIYIKPRDKHEKLKAIKACLRCGYTNHITSDCRFNFKQLCSTCGGKHFNFLCPKSNDGGSSYPRKFENKPINSGTITIDFEALFTRNSSNVILPTFSCKLNDTNDIRCLKDSGCQASFITQAYADANALEIIHSDISLTVKGFNETKQYAANVVKVNINTGSSVEIIEAVCIPDIPTKLSLPGLSNVFENFQKKGIN